MYLNAYQRYVEELIGEYESLLLSQLLNAVNFKFGIELTSRFWAKMISSVVVVISNYYISKLLVFKEKKADK